VSKPWCRDQGVVTSICKRKQGVKTLVWGLGCRNPNMQEKQGVKTLVQGSRCRNLDMQEKTRCQNLGAGIKVL